LKSANENKGLRERKKENCGFAMSEGVGFASREEEEGRGSFRRRKGTWIEGAGKLDKGERGRCFSITRNGKKRKIFLL